MNTGAHGSKEEKTPKVQTRNCSTERNKKIPKVVRITHTMNAISKTGKGDSSGPQSICAFSKRCDIGFAGVCRGLSSGIIGRFLSVCYTCYKSDNNAKGHAVGTTNQRRESLKTLIHPLTLKFGPFQGHQILPK